MTMKTIPIRVSFAFLRGPDLGICSRGEAVVKGMSGNAAFPQPPVDLTVLKTTLGNYSAAISAALDGGKGPIANRQALRVAASKPLRLLGHYVEVTADGNIDIFVSSGYEVLTVNRTGPQPLADPTIRNIAQGRSGELLVSLAYLPKALAFDMHYALAGAGGVLAPWISLPPIVGIRTPVSVTGLTPGGVYSFQVRALGSLGYTDWSSSFIKMTT